MLSFYLTSCWFFISFASSFLLFQTSKFAFQSTGYILSLGDLLSHISPVELGPQTLVLQPLSPFQAPYSDPALYSLAPWGWLVGISNFTCSKKNSGFYSHFSPSQTSLLYLNSGTTIHPLAMSLSLSSHIHIQSVSKLCQLYLQNTLITVTSITTSTSTTIFQLDWPSYSFQDITLNLNNLFPIEQPGWPNA